MHLKSALDVDLVITGKLGLRMTQRRIGREL
jgi:hypothetical protein